ncbi:hypothetical protein ILYODFUR_023183 [Ilyodon furcidens]|uniref:Uncharacterized protein n=1 Tax=Ilyodon furcidens TaxID=33524 RepID=A0ABV0SQC4_9TELE
MHPGCLVQFLLIKGSSHFQLLLEGGGSHHVAKAEPYPPKVEAHFQLLVFGILFFWWIQSQCTGALLILDSSHCACVPQHADTQTEELLLAEGWAAVRR